MISVGRLLRDYVELQEVATRQQIKTLAEFTECPPHKIQMLALIGDDEQTATCYHEEILHKRKSVLDLLEEYPACALPVEIYPETLPLLRPRNYSISSSPLKNSQVCSITVAVVESPARSGHGTFKAFARIISLAKTMQAKFTASLKIQKLYSDCLTIQRLR